MLLTVPDLVASAQAWQGPALTSHLLAAIDEHRSEPWLRLIDRYIEADPANRPQLPPRSLLPIRTTSSRNAPEPVWRHCQSPHVPGIGNGASMVITGLDQLRTSDAAVARQHSRLSGSSATQSVP